MRSRDLATVGGRSKGSVRLARSADDVGAARRLFSEYRQWHIDHRAASGLTLSTLEKGLRYLDAEIASLTGQFAPPRGAIVLAWAGLHPVGCGGLRPLGRAVGEIKRVYVRDSARGAGFGRRITRALLAHARRHGYRRVLLDTLPSMTSAIAIYRSLGFVPTRPYWSHPAEAALFFEYRIRRTPPDPPARWA